MKNLLRSLIFLVGLLLVTEKGLGQVTIASDGLNNSTSLFTLSGGAYYTGNSATGDRPASSPFASESTHSRGMSNGTATLTSSNINTSSHSGVEMTFRLASFSITTTGNGADAPDIVTVDVSPNGGTNYYSTVRVLGLSNAQWSYAGGTGNASTAYDGNITSVDFQPSAGGNRTTDGYSTVTITSLPSVNNLRIRITLLNNSNNERWLVDDFKVTGTASASGPKYWDALAGANNGVGDSATWGTTFSTTAAGDATLTTAGTSDDVIYQGTAGTVTLSANQTVASHTFNVDGYIIVTSGSGARTLAGTIDLTTRNITFAPISSSDLTISGVISGTGSASNTVFTKNGTGVLTLSSAANTFTGKVLVTAGLLDATGESRFGANPGSFTTDQITLNGGGIRASTGNIAFSSNRGISLGASGGTFEVANGRIITLSNIVAGTGGLTKTGAGELRLDVNSGSHTYTGATAITAGILRLERDNDIADASNVILNGGTLSTARSSDNVGRDETIGTLQLSNNSTIALGTGSHNLVFAASNAVSWAGTTLTINGWTGTAVNSGTAGKIFVGGTNAGLTSAQLDKINFNGFGTGASILLTGEIVPRQTITTSAITGSPFCVGNSATASVSVPFTVSSAFNSGNVFTAQLSNASGSFASPTNIGTLTSTIAGTISATIPASAGAGNGYRIRVIASNPTQIGSENTTNLTIQSFSAPTAFVASCSNATASATWTNPGCFDEVMVVAKASAFTSALPTGTNYTANLDFTSTSSTAFDGGKVVYKGTGTASGTITNLTNGTNYHFKVFARKGSVWVAGGNDNCTPENICGTESFETGLPTAYTSTTSYTLSSSIWTGQANGVIRGTSGVQSGSYSLQLRSQTAAEVTSPTLSSGVGTLSLYASSSSVSGAFQINISTDNGATWNPAPGSPFTSVSTIVTPYTTTINNANVNKIQFYRTGATIYIDDVSWSCFAASCTVPTDVFSASTSNCVNKGTTLSWTNSSCYDEILVVANQGAVLFTPSSTPSIYNAYSANTTYTTANQIVYKGTGSTVNIANLTNNLNYTYKIFARKDNNWSAGVNVNCTPILQYCPATSANCDEYIYNVSFNDIDNTSGAYSCGTNGYSNFTSQSTQVTKGDTYVLSVSTGIVGDGAGGNPNDGNDWYYVGDDIYVWVDWNQDGDFNDAGENVASVNDIENFGGPGSYNITIPSNAATGNTRMRVRLFYLDENDACVETREGETEDYTINIQEPCNPLISITDFNPKSGPALTLVNITGSGFNNLASSNAISINGVPITNYTIISSTLLQVEIPFGTSTAQIVINDNQSTPCVVRTASNFTILNQSGTCGANTTSGSNLMISEVYDSDAGSCHYIEIFNPTTSNVNLSGWNLRISTFSGNINLSGTINSGALYVVRFFNQACSSCSPTINQHVNGGGFNANDFIRLYNVNTEIDEVRTPNQTGFTMRRNANITTPNTTFTNSEWTTNTTESCTHLGTAPFNPTQTDVTIVNQPIDITSCTPIFEVDATTTQGPLTYQWKFNDRVSATWTNLTNGTWMGLTVSGATSDIISFTGNGASINGYQFYCEVTGNSVCTKNTNAVQFQYGNFNVYRTKATGNWNNTAIWETATSLAGPWANACEFPTSISSSSVSILNNHVVTLNVDVSIDSTVIVAGGQLVIADNKTYTVLNGNTGTDFYVYGTLYDRVASPNGLAFEDNASTSNDASWLLGTDGTIIKTNTSSVNNYKNFYQGGINNIPATAHWYYRYNGDGNPNTTAVDMFYPNLYFENTANTSNFSWNSFAMALTGGNGGFCTVKGDLNIGVTGTGTVTVLNNNFNAQPMIIEGDLLTESGSTLTNVGYTTPNSSYNVSWREGTGFEVKGSILAEGTLDINSLDNTSNNIGLLKFSGNTTSQDVLGAGTFDLWNVEVNKSAGEVALDVPLIINNNINLVTGTLNANGNSISVGRNWTNTGATYTHGNNKVTFFGSNNTSINSGGLAVGKRFYDIEVNKSSNTVEVNSAGNTKAVNLIDIKTGILNINSNHTFESLKVKLNDSNSKLDIKSNAAMRVNP